MPVASTNRFLDAVDVSKECAIYSREELSVVDRFLLSLSLSLSTTRIVAQAAREAAINI